MNIWCKITGDDLDLKEISKWTKSPAAGAIVTFEGTTRNTFEDKDVTELSYECYEEMALNEMNKLCQETLIKYPDVIRVALHHKINDVPVGEVSVICCVSTPHRAEGFKACEHIMMELKTKVPIWKKEKYSQGESQWKENSEFHNRG